MTYKFKHELKKRNLTVKQVIRHLGYRHGTHIARYARGENGLLMESLQSIVRAMNELCPEMPTKLEDIFEKEDAEVVIH